MSKEGFTIFYYTGLKDGWQGLFYSFLEGYRSNGLQTAFYALGLGSTSVNLEGTQLSSASFFCRSLNLKLNLGFYSGTSIFISFYIFFPQGKGFLKGSYYLKEKLGAYYLFGSYFFGYSFLGSSFLTSELLSAVGTQPSSFFYILFLRLNLLGTNTG